MAQEMFSGIEDKVLEDYGSLLCALYLNRATLILLLIAEHRHDPPKDTREEFIALRQRVAEKTRQYAEMLKEQMAEAERRRQMADEFRRSPGYTRTQSARPGTSPNPFAAASPARPSSVDDSQIEAAIKLNQQRRYRVLYFVCHNICPSHSDAIRWNWKTRFADMKLQSDRHCKRKKPHEPRFFLPSLSLYAVADFFDSCKPSMLMGFNGPRMPTFARSRRMSS